jgi:radical SAM superfamily enzyme YgiQ (UPF0313 family)
MIDYHGIIFTDNAGASDKEYMKEEGLLTGVPRTFSGKAIGAYRLRTEAAMHGYNIRVVDMLYALTDEEVLDIIDHLISPTTKIIGFSATFLLMTNDDLVRKIKERFPSLKMVLGGGVINTKTYFRYNFEFKVSPSEFDYIVYGFAEKAFIKVLDHLYQSSDLISEKLEEYPNTYFVNGKKYGFDIENLRTVWLPEDAIDQHDFLPIEISRGCIFKCSFCSFELNGKSKFDYFRRVEEIEQEIRYNYETFGVTEYAFLDDTYNDSREKINLINDVLKRLDFSIKFCCYLKPELLVSFPEHIEMLVEQGLHSADFGVESFHPDARKAYNKGRNLDEMLEAIESMWKYSNGKVKNRFFIIAGSPYEPIESTVRTVDFCRDAEWIHNVGLNPLRIAKYDPKEEFNYSKIDINPEQYGYHIMGETDDISMNWKNDHTTFDEVKQVVAQKQVEIDQWRQPAGFKISRVATLFGEHKHEYLESNGSDLDICKNSILYTENRNKIRKQKMLDAIFNNVRTPINIEKHGLLLRSTSV